jgi:hypothetical protein
MAVVVCEDLICDRDAKWTAAMRERLAAGGMRGADTACGPERDSSAETARAVNEKECL